MSQRGFLPLLVATSIGVAGGMYTFGPLMKENSWEARQKSLKETTETASASKVSEEGLQKVVAAEAAASRNASTETVLSANAPSISRWQSMGGWLWGSGTKDSQPSKRSNEAPTTDPEKKA
ncbi:hypothetical protein HYALB_00011938 [Hymenoscyphus albidus]|uniref:Uncharacterized protein n=1 Tax=Hymenoscyphus albidus TaxID=595503 RepID=A0A9N9PU74_9HELO|nr:hypothetical protein HYALB_00011938 [Hymenoscyphus albidus]